MTKMTTEEAFVKVLQMHGIEHAFGIIGSAMMPISDLFPEAGIKFWDCAHETSGGMMADGKRFTDFEEYRELLLDERDKIVSALIASLLVYATGAEIQFADREVVESIRSEVANSDDGLRSIIHGIVQSRPFLRR